MAMIVALLGRLKSATAKGINSHSTPNLGVLWLLLLMPLAVALFTLKACFHYGALRVASDSER